MKKNEHVSLNCFPGNKLSNEKENKVKLIYIKKK